MSLSATLYLMNLIGGIGITIFSMIVALIICIGISLAIMLHCLAEDETDGVYVTIRKNMPRMIFALVILFLIQSFIPDKESRLSIIISQLPEETESESIEIKKMREVINLRIDDYLKDTKEYYKEKENK